jgi:hypothetical protein
MVEVAQALAVTAEMETFRAAERAFVDAGEDHRVLFESAARLAELARAHGAMPEDILIAMRIAGCVRSEDLGESDGRRSSRYWIALSALLTSFFTM